MEVAAPARRLFKLSNALGLLTAHLSTVEYGPADEPWGVRRFSARDPFPVLARVLSREPVDH
jgi:hypothetical protein